MKRLIIFIILVAAGITEIVYIPWGIGLGMQYVFPVLKNEPVWVAGMLTILAPLVIGALIWLFVDLNWIAAGGIVRKNSDPISEEEIYQQELKRQKKMKVE